MLGLILIIMVVVVCAALLYRSSTQKQQLKLQADNQAFQQSLHEILSYGLILDTETTGLTKNAEIIEISIIDTHGNVLLDTLVKPSKRMRADNKASQIHGITNEHLADAPKWSEIHDQVCEILKNRKVIIYNSSFDTRLLHQTAAKYNLEVPNFIPQCAMQLYGYWEGTASSRGGYKWHKLEAACQRLGVILTGTAHRSLTDCYSTLSMLKKLKGAELQPRKSAES